MCYVLFGLIGESDVVTHNVSGDARQGGREQRFNLGARLTRMVAIGAAERLPYFVDTAPEGDVSK